MAYSFQSYNTKQLAQGLDSPRRSYNFSAAASKYRFGSGRFGTSETQASVIRAVQLKDTTAHMTPMLKEKQGAGVC